MKTFEIEVDVDDVRSFDVKEFEELTLGDYRRIMGGGDHERPHEIIERVFGIPGNICRVMTAPEMAVLLEWYGDIIKEGNTKWGEMVSLRKMLNEIKEEKGIYKVEDLIQGLEERKLMFSHIEVQDKRFPVSRQLDFDAKYGQWHDFEDLVNGRKWTEVELYPQILTTFCLLPGEKYSDLMEKIDPDNPHSEIKYDERVRMFDEAKFVEVLGVVGFFFYNSNSLRSLTDRILISFLKSSQLWKKSGRIVSQSVGERGQG